MGWLVEQPPSLSVRPPPPMKKKSHRDGPRIEDYSGCGWVGLPDEYVDSGVDGVLMPTRRVGGLIDVRNVDFAHVFSFVFLHHLFLFRSEFSSEFFHKDMPNGGEIRNSLGRSRRICRRSTLNRCVVINNGRSIRICLFFMICNRKIILNRGNSRADT